MPNLRIIPKNWFDEASSVTVTSEASSSMTIGNAATKPRGQVWRSSSTASQVIQGNWANVVRKSNALALFRHNAHGGTVRLQLYSDTTWTTQVYDSTALSVSTTPSGSYDWGDATGVDPLLYESPYVLYFTEATTAKAFRITLGGTPAIGTYWQVGRIWLGRYFEVGANPDFGAGLGWAHSTESDRSRGGSVYATDTARWRTSTLDLRQVSENDRQTWMDIRADRGLSNDFVISLFAGVGGRKERDYTLNAKFTNPDPILYGVSVHQHRLVVEEI